MISIPVQVGVRQPEINEVNVLIYMPVLSDQHVVWLYITVHKAKLVKNLKAAYLFNNIYRC
jgi:hypothetical protein